MFFNTINDLRNFSTTNPPPAEEYIVSGFYYPGDGGGGVFVWVPNTVTTPYMGDDGGIIIATNIPLNPLYHQGYFKRIYSGPINVRWFGAKGDGITDDTAAVHAARNAANNGTVYFPASKTSYRGNFSFDFCHVIGDGYDSVLQTYTAGRPVLKLGWRPSTLGNWAFTKVSGLKIFGSLNTNDRSSDGVMFDALSTPELAGRWAFEEVSFFQCNKGIYKPKGNIGNVYTNCNISRNNFGYYAEDISGMHSGCERFVGCQLEKCDIAALYVKADYQYGQLILDGTVIEQNKGFGVFVKLNGAASMTFTGVELRNVWMEGNATSPVVDIDGVSYNTRTLRFENVRSVSIYQSIVLDMELIGSSVHLYNCKSDRRYTVPPWNWPYRIITDISSSITAQELRYENSVAENIFVESISYDGTDDILKDPKVPTSVWGPLRTTLMAGLDNVVMWSGPQQELGMEIWPGFTGADGNVFDLLDSGTALNYVNSSFSPQQAITCKILRLDYGQIVKSPQSFIPQSGYYYFWSIHAKVCSPNEFEVGQAAGWFGAEPGNDEVLGLVIFKSNQWACSYGIKKYIGSGVNLPFHLWFEGVNTQSSIRFCHWQVLEFEQLADAVAYMRNKGIAYPGTQCEIHPVGKV